MVGAKLGRYSDKPSVKSSASNNDARCDTGTTTVFHELLAKPVSTKLKKSFQLVQMCVNFFLLFSYVYSRAARSRHCKITLSFEKKHRSIFNKWDHFRLKIKLTFRIQLKQNLPFFPAHFFLTRFLTTAKTWHQSQCQCL